MHTTSNPMSRVAGSTPSPSALLRNLLGFDASTCAVLGFALVAANGLAARLTGLPAGALAEAGVFLIVFAVAVGWIAIRKASSRRAVSIVVDANLLWAIGSVAIAAFGIDSATTIGRALVAVQGLAVGVLALFEWFALRRGLGRG